MSVIFNVRKIAKEYTARHKLEMVIPIGFLYRGEKNPGDVKRR